jgi:hypothetical protein
MSGGQSLEPEDLQSCQKLDTLQDQDGYLRLLFDESPMHRQQNRASSAAPP